MNDYEIFIRVEKILKDFKVLYKVISSSNKLAELNSGDLGYTQIGKFVTVYPRNNQEFIELIESLYRATIGFQAVDIPSDFRYKNSCVIFYRYGEMCVSDGDTQSLDLREKIIPEGIVVPIKDYYIKRFEKFPERYIPIMCMRARGKSRVFQCIDASEKIKVITKEGLMLGEVNLNGLDGANSIMQEKEILLALSDVPAFPRIIDSFYVGSTFVIVEEFKEGKTLKQLFEDEEYSLIELHKKRILSQLLDLLVVLHQKEICVGDLSLDNIILNDEGGISLIDVEYYRMYNQVDDNMLGTAGFWCKEYRGNKATRYAFISLWYYLSFPLNYSEFLKNTNSIYKCNLDKYQLICDDAIQIMETDDQDRALKLLRNHIIGENGYGDIKN